MNTGSTSCGLNSKEQTRKSPNLRQLTPAVWNDKNILYMKARTAPRGVREVVDGGSQDLGRWLDAAAPPSVCFSWRLGHDRREEREGFLAKIKKKQAGSEFQTLFWEGKREHCHAVISAQVIPLSIPCSRKKEPGPETWWLSILSTNCSKVVYPYRGAPPVDTAETRIWRYFSWSAFVTKAHM